MFGSWRESRDARRKGKRDGRAGVPAVADEAIPFDLREILARAEERKHQLLRRWRRDDGTLALELNDLEQRTADAAERLTDAEARRDAAREDHERRLAEEDERLERLQAQLEELPSADAPEIRFEEPTPEPPLTLVPIAGGSPPSLSVAAQAEATAGDARTETPETLGDAWTASAPSLEGATWRGIGPVLYWLVIGLILLGEFPLNAVAFRLFGESDLFTYVMTASLAVALVALAHVLGTLVAHETRTRADRLLIGVFAVVPVAGIAVISLIRYDYLAELDADSAIGPVLGTLAFALINLLVFAAAAGWSYLRHDPRTVASRRAAARTLERDRDQAERRLARREQERRDRERKTLEETRRRDEEQLRLAAEAERGRRRLALEQESDRQRAELEARRNEGMLRREQILEAMGPIREAADGRLRALGALDRDVEDARTALADVEQRVRAIDLERRARWEASEAGLREIRAHRDRLAFAYCSANVRARKDHATPGCFEQIPPLEWPEGPQQGDAA